MTLDERLVDLLMLAEELRDQGRVVSAEELCRDCPELLPELRRLLDGTGALDQLLHASECAGPDSSSALSAVTTTRLGDGNTPAPAGPRPPPSVPGYEIVGELGRGGMGVVYQARHRALGRTVALKVIRSGAHADEDDRRRFRAEAEAVARLSHPNIVQVYEVGEYDGLPFCALEYVEGGSLAQRLARKPLSPREAARLVGLLAGAMHLAHSRNVVHRDLKPANVLLAACGFAEGAKPQAAIPKITDFGLARRLDVETAATQVGAIMGTPAYMAPEQASGQPHAAGPAADVYALGGILYECLTGRPPFVGDTLLATLEQVRNRDPVPPRRLRPKVPADLETVCLKCLRKEPERRYSSARELADDLGRFLNGEPVSARPAGAAARLAKWARRRPALAGVYALAALVLLLGGLGGGAAALWQRAEQARGRLAGEKRLTEEALRRVTAAGEAEARAGQAEREANDRLQQALYLRQVSLALAEWRDSAGARMAQMLAECPEGRRGWEWHYAHNLSRADLLTLRGHRDRVRGVAFSPDGGSLASASDDGTVKVWDADTGREKATFRGRAAQVGCVAFSPDGRSLAAGLSDQTVKVWDVGTGQESLTLAADGGTVGAVAFSTDGARLAAGCENGTVRVWDAHSGSAVATFQKHARAVRSLAFSPDGRRLASAAGAMKVWDVQTGRDAFAPFYHFGQGGSVGVAFSPDGQFLASIGPGMRVNVWDTVRWRQKLTIEGLDGAIRAVAFSPDGSRLAFSSEAGTVTVFDTAKGERVSTRYGVAGGAWGVAYSPDGRRLAAAFDDGTAKVWATVREDALTLPAHSAHVFRVAFSPDGERLAVATDNKTVELWDARTGRLTRTLRGHGDRVWCVAFSPDGKRLASGSADQTVKVWDAATGREQATLKGRGAAMNVAYSPDGRLLAGAWVDGMVRLWDGHSGKEVFTLAGHTAPVEDLSFSPDGRRLASASVDGTARVWDVRTGEEVLVFKGHGEGVWCVAFSPDGRRVASGGRDSAVRVWEADTGREVLTLRGHAGTVDALAFSPDGRRLASGSWDQIVKLWDTETGQEALTLKGHVRPVRGLAFSPDGRRLASAAGDGTVKVWDGSPGEDGP